MLESTGTKAEISISRSAVVYEGWQQNSLATIGALCVQRLKNAVVIVLLNEFSATVTSLDQRVSLFRRYKGSLINRLLSREYRKKKKPCLFLRIRVYVNDDEGPLNRSRSAGVRAVSSMQTITADVDENPDSSSLVTVILWLCAWQTRTQLETIASNQYQEKAQYKKTSQFLSMSTGEKVQINLWRPI